MNSFQPSPTIRRNADSIRTNLIFTRDWQEELRDRLTGQHDALIVCTPGVESRGTLALAVESLSSARSVSHLFAAETPDLHSLALNWDFVKGFQPNILIAIGGGSAIDSAKAVMTMLYSTSKDEFIEKVESGKSEISNETPLIVIPTTAGSGSEVTSFATIWDRDLLVKHSIEGQALIPQTAILDSSLLETLKDERLLFPALDAVSHSLESLWNTNRTPISKSYAMEALYSADFALKSYTNRDYDLDSFVQSSVHAGLAISITRTALAHSISYPLTLRYFVPHGLACSFTLSSMFKLSSNLLALSQSEQTIIESVLHSVESVNLARMLQMYCNREEMLSLNTKMLDRGRSNNFMLEVSPNLINQILENSLNAGPS